MCNLSFCGENPKAGWEHSRESNWAVPELNLPTELFIML